MEDNDDPYEILGVPRQATKQEIKIAYRKLALRHHPDKQSTDEGRQAATVLFAKISNAYEILGDERQRQQFDQEEERQLRQQQRRQQQQRNAAFSHQDVFHHHAFHDPFAVFEQFFQQEFGGPSTMRRGGPAGAGFMGPNLFDQDPFFGSAPHHPFAGFGGLGGFGGGFFGGGFGGPGRGGLFDSMHQQMNSMRNLQSQMMNLQQQQQFQHASLLQSQRPSNQSRQQQPPLQQQPSSVMFTTTSGGLGSLGSHSVSTSTTTRIVNGRRQVVTERIVMNPDGTVQRHVERSGDDDFPSSTTPRLAVGSSDSRRSTQPALEYPQPQQQPSRRRQPRQQSQPRQPQRTSQPPLPEPQRRRRSSSSQKSADQRREEYKQRRRHSSSNHNVHDP